MSVGIGENSIAGKINGIVELGNYPPGQPYGYSALDIAPSLFTAPPSDGRSIMGLSIGIATQVSNHINQFGLSTEVTSPSAYAGDLWAWYGTYAENDHNGSGTLHASYGVFASSYNSGSGTIFQNIGLYAEGVNSFYSGNGIINANYGIWARSGANAGSTNGNDYTIFVDAPYTGGIFTNGHTGILIADQTGGGIIPSANALKILGGAVDLGANPIFIESSASGQICLHPPTVAIGNVNINWPIISGTLALLGQLPITHTPISVSDTGTTGTIAWDSNFVYICTATNTWKRSALSSW
jgi:hypothetical protein